MWDYSCPDRSVMPDLRKVKGPFPVVGKRRDFTYKEAITHSMSSHTAIMP